MARSTHRPALRRRVVLVLDCLEDRFAPAALALLGQSVSDIIPVAPRIELNAAAVGQFSVAAQVAVFAAMGNSARLDDVPFGFFHPFCQNGFGGGDMMTEAPPLPQPRPVLPPLDPAQFLAEPDFFDPPLPAAPPAAIDIPAPPAELPPSILRTPAPEEIVAPREQRQSSRILESAPESMNNPAPVTPARNAPRKGLAAIGGLLAAASLLFTRNVRERRYDNIVAVSY